MGMHRAGGDAGSTPGAQDRATATCVVMGQVAHDEADDDSHEPVSER
jgi:hypothetical protein